MSRITDYPALSPVATDDVVAVVDVDDPTQSPAGTTKQATVADLLAAAVVAGALLAANNLSDLPDKPTARTNLGLGTAATHAAGDFDAAGAAAAVTLASLGAAAAAALTAEISRAQAAEALAMPKTGGAFTGTVTSSQPIETTSFLQGLRTLINGEVGASSAVRYSGATTSGHPTTGSFTIGAVVPDLSGTIWICTASGSPGTFVEVGAASLAAAVAAAVASSAQRASNLSDLASAPTARTNLGLGTAAVAALSSLLQAANNLSELASPATARVNLGLTWKDPVQQVTTGALPSSTYASGPQTLTATANGALTVDGVAVAATQRILVSQQATAQNNGIYLVTQAGDASHPWILTRAPDMATGGQVTGATVMVEQGSTQAGSGWFVEGAGPDTIGTTAIFWTKFTVIISGVTPQPLGVAAPGASGNAADNAHVHAMPSVDQLGVPAADVAWNAKKITGLANGTSAQDAAAFGQIPAANGQLNAWAVLASTVTSTSTSLADVTGIGLAVASGGTYLCEWVVYYQQTAATADGVAHAVNGPATSQLIIDVERFVNTTAPSRIVDTAYNTSRGSTVNATGTTYPIHFRVLATFTAAGTIIPRFANQAGLGTVVVQAGSWGVARRIS